MENKNNQVEEFITKLFSIDDIRKRVRTSEYVNARMTYAYIMRKLGLSLTQIGKSIGKDHSTIIHYIKSIESYIKTDDELLKKFNNAKKEFLNEKEDPVIVVDNSELLFEINSLKDKIKSLNLEIYNSQRKPEFNEQDMLRFGNIFKVIKQRTKHGDEYKVFQKLNSIYNVL